MIQQKAAELLFSMPPAKRSLDDLRHAIEQAGHAQKCVFLIQDDLALLIIENIILSDYLQP